MSSAYLIELIDQMYEVLVVCQNIIFAGESVPDGFLARLDSIMGKADDVEAEA